MDDASISSSSSSVPTATLPLICYSLDLSVTTANASMMRYHVRCPDRSQILHSAKNYEIKSHSYRRVIKQVAEEAPTFRVGVLTNQNTRSIAAILNCERRIFEKAPPCGSLALEAKYNRGEKLVEDVNKRIFSSNTHQSVRPSV